MKTTVDLPDAMFRQAKALAAARGVTLRRFFTEALKAQLLRCKDDIAPDTRDRPRWPASARCPRSRMNTVASSA